MVVFLDFPAQKDGAGYTRPRTIVNSKDITSLVFATSSKHKPYVAVYYGKGSSVLLYDDQADKLLDTLKALGHNFYRPGEVPPEPEPEPDLEYGLDV